RSPARNRPPSPATHAGGLPAPSVRIAQAGPERRPRGHCPRTAAGGQRNDRRDGKRPFRPGRAGRTGKTPAEVGPPLPGQCHSGRENL
nr:hypothetical protein [Tanacetum cinerariifolium]